MNNTPARKKRTQPTDAQLKFLGKYRFFTSILAIILGIIIVIKGIKLRGALPPILLGLCLCGLGISRLWTFTLLLHKKQIRSDQ